MDFTGSDVRRLRQGMEIDQEEFAKRVGVSHSLVRKWESSAYRARKLPERHYARFRAMTIRGQHTGAFVEGMKASSKSGFVEKLAQEIAGQSGMPEAEAKSHAEVISSRMGLVFDRMFRDPFIVAALRDAEVRCEAVFERLTSRVDDNPELDRILGLPAAMQADEMFSFFGKHLNFGAREKVLIAAVIDAAVRVLESAVDDGRMVSDVSLQLERILANAGTRKPRSLKQLKRTSERRLSRWTRKTRFSRS